jgi:hypothetical protein
MLADVVEVRAGWGPRAETAQVCAERLARMLAGLAPLHPVYRHLGWASKGYAGSSRQLPADAGKDVLAEFLLPLRHYDPDRRRRVTDGFRIQAGNSHQMPPEIEILLDMRVGCAEGPPQFWFPNSMSLTTNTREEADNDFTLLRALKPTLLAFIDAWEPQRAGLFSSAFGHIARQKGEESPFVGSWAVYVAADDTAEITVPPARSPRPFPVAVCC